ncbi:MAG: ATP-binding cassette domain-containing protein [Desulfosarcinaceae bacterium]
MARIDLQEVAHSYRANPGGAEDFALKRIHTTWQDGGAYALLGPSGCGKTTLLNVIKREPPGWPPMPNKRFRWGGDWCEVTWRPFSSTNR